MLTRRARDLRGQRGAMAPLFAVVLPLLMFLIAMTFDVGNWFVHGRHLQTKVDAGAFAAGGSWAIPCGPSSGLINAEIEDAARRFVGPHTKADTQPYTTPHNPQVGKTETRNLHVVLNGLDWFDEDSNPGAQDKTGPTGPYCESMTLDVKGTESNTGPLFGWLPLFPDIKRKARIEIQEGEAFKGLLPIAVRVPKPVSAAAIFFDETPGASYGRILDARYMCEATAPLAGQPTELGGWTTYDPTNTQGPGGTSMCPDWSNVNVTTSAGDARVGVAIALSFRRACGAAAPGNNCFNVPGTFTNVNQLCNQVTGGPSGGVPLATCYFGSGEAPAWTARSGLQFIRGYGSNSDPQPDVRGAWIDSASGTNCHSYFAAPVTNPCDAVLHVDVDRGAAPPGDNVEVRYKMVSGNTSPLSDDAPGDCGNNFNAGPGQGCDVIAGQAPVEFDPQYARHAFAIQVRLRNVPLTQVFPLGPLPAACALGTYSNLCRWFFTGAGRDANIDPTDDDIFFNPIQRQFMGDVDLSGPIKWLNVVADTSPPCDSSPLVGFGETGQAASVPAGNHCFYVNMGLQGAIPPDQDVPPIAFNLSTTSQHQLLDCDPAIPQGQIEDAIARGCEPLYKSHDFEQQPLCPDQNSIFLLPQPPPWQGWDPKTCVKTRPTTSGNQLQQGFNFRFFGEKNNPTCPPDVSGFQKGRNYWNDANNANDTVTKTINGQTFTFDTTYTEQGPSSAHDYAIPPDDPRLVTLFFTPYYSFGFNGQATFPVVGLGQFYVTGYGRAGQNDDPCTGGNSSGIPGAGNLPPPDLRFGNNYFVWGHFIKDVILAPRGTPSGRICDPASLTPCVVALVE